MILMFAVVLFPVAGGFILNGVRRRRKWKVSDDIAEKEAMLNDFAFALITIGFFIFASLGEYQKTGAN